MTESLFDGLAPLAARMRPRSLDEIVGQGHLLRKGTPLYQLAEPEQSGVYSNSTSVVLWGPPGTGKTTIAKVIALSSGRRFVELSAVTSGVKDVREAIDRARLDRESFGSSTILFLDEIHRFSKAQQDVLLPAVESGWVVLVAATTENPSFSVISPLLSRSLMLTLNPIESQDLETLLKRALTDSRGLGSRFAISDEALTQIAGLSGGDARKALTILEAAAQAIQTDGAGASSEITVDTIALSIDKALVRYDAQGDQHYDVISAFIKSVRGSDVDAALHYLARMLEGGEDPRFIARRLIILASEDIGLADSGALAIAVSAAEAVAKIGMPEGRIPLSQATIYLCLAPKSNSAYLAIDAAIADIRSGKSAGIPLALRSSNYPGARKATGAGVGYKYPHDDPISVVPQRYLDGEVENSRYFQPKQVGAERELGERWSKLRAIIRSLKK
jgi:putative ATPase